jgi:hypothetical protein
MRKERKEVMCCSFCHRAPLNSGGSLPRTAVPNQLLYQRCELMLYTTTMSTSHATDIAHSEVISALTELYTLLTTLAAVPPGAFWLANLHPLSNSYTSDTGYESHFNTKAALLAGFSMEAVRVLVSIPCWDHPIHIQPETRTKNHLGQDRDDFSEERDLFYGCEEMLPPSIVRLTERSSQSSFWSSSRSVW